MSAAMHTSLPPSVLVVDDVPESLLATVAMLAPLGVAVIAVTCGREAVERVKRQALAVVLLEAAMSEMDGFETTARIRATDPGRDVPILLVGGAQRDDRLARRAYAAGAADYLPAPLDPEVLRARVGAFVGLFRQREQVRAAEVGLRTLERDEATRKLSAFERIAAAALGPGNVRTFLTRLLETFIEAADAADWATVLLWEGDTLRTRALVGLPEDEELRLYAPKLGDDLAGRVAAEREPLHVADAQTSPLVLTSAYRRNGTRGLLGVPLLHDGELVGVALIGSWRASYFSPTELRLLRALGDRAAWALAIHTEQSHLRNVLTAVPTAICAVRGPRFEYEFTNPAYATLIGQDTVLGRSFAEVGALEEIVPLLEVARQTETVCVREELRARIDGLADGHFRVNVKPDGGSRDSRGGVDRLFVFVIDLSERVTLLERERAARADAEIANRAKDEFLATVSHELRTPLSAILGWARAVRRGVSTPERAFEIIERNALAQAHLIDDVLDLSRIISGKLRLEPSRTRLEEPIRAAVEALRPAADAKHIELATRIEPLGEIVADAERIQQIVWNLISNAVKFTPAGGHIELSAERRDDDYVLVVMDDGDGIAPAFLPNVFDPFRQADGSTTRRHGGLGLGLAIVKQLVAAHGGTIRVASDGPGRGSTFTLTLPLGEERASARRLPVSPRAGASLGTAEERLDKVRLLVVDDEEDARLLLAYELGRRGAEVSQAASMREALDALEVSLPHVIISDIAMPEEDGYQLMQALRERSPERGGRTPAIALTAYARSEDVERSLRVGFQVHLSKPVDIDRLVASIATFRAPALPRASEVEVRAPAREPETVS